MPSSLSTFLTINGITDYLRGVPEFAAEKKPPNQATKLLTLKKQLQKAFFNTQTNLSDADILNIIENNPQFAASPELSHLLRSIFKLNNENNNDEILETLKHPPTDINTTTTHAEFERLNHLYGYFTQPEKKAALQLLFTELAASCQAIATLIEQNNHISDTMAYENAYKIMALFINESEEPLPTFQALATATNDLLTKGDNKTPTPFYDVLYQKVSLPPATAITDKQGWIRFIKREREKALPYFEMAAEIEQKTNFRAPTSAQAAKVAAVRCKYQRADEDIEFASLCYGYKRKTRATPLDEDDGNGGSLEDVFEKSLDFIQTGPPPGWPKKTSDTIPNIATRGEGVMQDDKDIADGYHWVKLPPTDKRALILGKITDCCQSIGGHSEACVKDAVTSNNNALYVLLKQRSGGQAASPMLPDKTIDYSKFQIVGQSYVWRGEGGLCLDSVECLKNRVPNAVLKSILTRFSHHVIAEDASVQRVTIGRGGKTPEALFLNTDIPLHMREGTSYGDADNQYLIAQSPRLSSIDNPELDALWQTYANTQADYATQLASLPEEKRRLVLNAEDREGRTLLHAAIAGLIPPTLNDVLALYPDAEARLEAIEKPSRQGDTALHYAAFSSLNDFHRLMALYPNQTQKIKALSTQGQHGQTPLHTAAYHSPAVALTILDMLDNPEQKLAAITQADQNDKTVLFYAAHGNSTVFRTILSFYPAEEKRAALREQTKDGKTILFEASNQPEILALIVDELGEKLIETMEKRNQTGQSAFHHIVKNPDALAIFLDKLSQDQLMHFLSLRDQLGRSPLFNLITAPASLKKVLAKLSIDQCIDVLTRPDCQNENFLHLLIWHNGDALPLILESIPVEHYLKILIHPLPSGERALHWLTKSYPAIFRQILETLSQEQLSEAVKIKNNHAQTILHIAAQHHPDMVHLILDKLSLPEQVEALKVQYNQKTILDDLSDFSEVFKNLDNIALDDILSIKNRFGQTVLHIAARHHPEAFASLLTRLSNDEQLIKAIGVTDILGQTVLHAARDKKTELKLLLNKIPKDACQTLLKQVDINGENILDSLMNNTTEQPPILMHVLDELLPIVPLSELLTLRSKYEKTLLSITATNNQAIFITLLNQLSEPELIGIFGMPDGSGSELLALLLRHTETLLKVFNKIDKNQLLAIFKIPLNDGHTLLHRAVFQYPEQLPLLLKALPSGEQLKALTLESAAGHTVLDNHLTLNPTHFIDILNSLSKADRTDACMLQNAKGETVLHRLAYRTPSDLLLIADLQADKLNEVFNKQDKTGKTIWHYLQDSLSPGIILHFLNQLPHPTQIEALKQYNQDESVLHTIFADTDNPMVNALLHQLTHKELMDVLSVTDAMKQTPLHLAIEWNPSALTAILSKLSLSEFKTLIEVSHEPFNASEASLKICKDWLLTQITTTHPTEETTQALINDVSKATSVEQLLDEALLSRITTHNTKASLQALKPHDADEPDASAAHAP